jgi:hypothetical protein
LVIDARILNRDDVSALRANVSEKRAVVSMLGHDVLEERAVV